MTDAGFWISRLGLLPHPEGGYFRETYRSRESISAAGLPARFSGDRSCATAIYFLLAADDFSSLHRIKSDETWHFYAGSPLAIHVISEDGRHSSIHLGPDPDRGESFQATVTAGLWFGAEVTGGGYSLVGCTVAPGFHFCDFEIGKRDYLLQSYPHLTDLICRLTRES